MMVKQTERFYLFYTWKAGNASRNIPKFSYKVSTMFDFNENRNCLQFLVKLILSNFMMICSAVLKLLYVQGQ